MENLDSLFTIQSLVSLQGAAAAALMVPNVLGILLGDKFDPFKKWIAFFVAMSLSYVVAYLAPSIDFMKWILAFFNGFLVFASAVGINQASMEATAPIHSAVLGGTTRPSLIRLILFNEKPVPDSIHRGKGFFSSWF